MNASLRIALALALLSISGFADEQPAADSDATLHALQAFNPLIGQWRGVGMRQRGSSRGAWSEKAEWIWDFSGEQPAIQEKIEGSELHAGAKLAYDPQSETYTLTAALAGDDQSEDRVYRGKLDGTKLTLESEPDTEGFVHRVTLTQLNPKRTIVLHQKRKANSDNLTRVAEIGYTREGTKLAEEGTNGPECIVTGGAGTIAVSYEGKTYFVCCTGCKQAFDDDPAGTIAEYEARLAEKKAAQSGTPQK